MSRYTGPLRVRLSSPAARYLEDAGRLLLGELETRASLGGVEVLDARRELPDGALVIAARRGTQRTLTLVAPVDRVLEPKRETTVELGGFVTWPTDDAGATALTTDRIVLAGEEFRAVREDRYSALFPDGLNRAGNVDWHGKGGWVLSWYGPRTRYLDASFQLQPWVFFKGRELVDARDYIDTDAVILGAAVVTVGEVAWLLVVSEEFFFGRWEDVWAVKLRDPDAPDGKALPTSARLEPIADSYVYLDGRENDDFLIMRHPWFFSPTGREGRMLTEDDESQLLERIIRVVDDTDPEGPGFRIERDGLVHPHATRTRYGGYSAGVHIAPKGQQTIVIDRVDGTDWRGSLPPDWPPGPYPDPITMDGALTPQTAVAETTLCPRALQGWRYVEGEDVVTGERWQPCAVDYRPNGEVVRGYARIAETADAASGDYNFDVGSSITCSFSDNSYQVTFSPAGIPATGGGWSIGIDTHGAHHLPGVQASFSGSAQRTRRSTLAGLRIGLLELETVDQLDFSASCSWTHGHAEASVPDPVGGDTGSNPPHSLPCPADENAAHVAMQSGQYGQSYGGGASASTSSLTEELYLLHMDLRNDSLFTVMRRVEQAQVNENSITWEFDGAVTTSDGHTRSRSQKRQTWVTRGWVHGSEVVNETLVTEDTFATAPWVETDYEDNTAVTGATFINASLGALVAPSESSWDVPNSTVVGFPRDGGVYGVYGGHLSSGVPGPLGYGIDGYGEPIAQQNVIAFAGEIEPDDELVGMSFPNDATSVKVRWHEDADGQLIFGAWAGYRGRYAFSMPLLVQNLEATECAHLSLCSVGTIESVALASGEVVAHFSPIWVLAGTRGFRPA